MRSKLNALIVLGTLIALMASCSSCIHSRARNVPKPLSEYQREAAVRITSLCVLPDGRMSAGQGSGTIIASHRVLTANHVVECSGQSVVFVETFGGYKYVARVGKALERHDIAVLETLEPLPRVRHFGISLAHYGSTICYEASVPTRARKCGRVLMLRSEGGADLLHSADTESGNSGSGVFDSRGALIGVVTTRNGDSTGGGVSTLHQHKSDLPY